MRGSKPIGIRDASIHPHEEHILLGLMFYKALLILAGHKQLEAYQNHGAS